MIFGDGADDYQTRCETWDEAERQHRKAVEHAVELVRQADEIVDGKRPV